MVSKPGPSMNPYREEDAQDVPNEKPRKIRRITRACDYCHKRSIKCRASQDLEDKRCQNCYEFAQPCTYDRPVKRRGAKKRSPSPEVGNGRYKQGNGVSGEALNGSHGPPAGPQGSFTAYGHAFVSREKGSDWRAPELASQAMIVDLVEIYFEIVYPMLVQSSFKANACLQISDSPSSTSPPF
jgi:Fungal Zn(2)-Cys(6) binuclear cluster domain